MDAGGLKVTYDGYKSTSPTYTDAGTYTVKYEVENNRNYEITGRTGSAVVQINPVKLTVTAADKTVDYDGEAHGITVTGLEGTNLKVYYGESASWCNSPSYTKTDAGCDDYTSTGTLARYGAIAVDPSVIPYGTRMYIVSNDGAYVYGIATGEDCGGAIGGARVDLYYDTTEECFAFGRRDCTIYFLA